MKTYKILFFTVLVVAISILFPSVYAIENEKIDQVTYDNYENNYNDYKSCGAIDGKDALIEDIPPSIPKVIHIIYLTILIAVPIVLVVFGSIDLFKGLYAQKDDEIKKGQQTFVKKLIAASLVFMAFMLVKIIVGIVADSNKNQIVDCAECFIENKCD